MNTKEFEIIQRVAQNLERNCYTGKLYEAADLYTAGWEGVSEAHDKFGHDVRESLLKNIIRRRMIDYIRLLRKRHGGDSTGINNARTFSDMSEIDFSQIVVDASIAQFLHKDAFDDIIKVLPPSERALVRMYIEDDMTYGEIGKIVGKTESRICQIFKKKIFPILEKTAK